MNFFRGRILAIIVPAVAGAMFIGLPVVGLLCLRCLAPLRKKEVQK